jgi:hypothetical protein
VDAEGTASSVNLTDETPARWHRTAGPFYSLLNRARQTARRVRWYMFTQPRKRTVARVKAQKLERRRSGQVYQEAPRVSVIIQSFNQVRNVGFLESRLRATCMDELIVCEDGSLDGSLEAWTGRLTRPNDFLLRSNDLHEIRTYTRAISHARGEFICLMQDDDRPPKDGRWLDDALRLFECYPQLAVLGGWMGFMQYFAEEYNSPWLLPDKSQIPYQDPHSGRNFMFVENVNIGPYLLRRRAYLDLGGFDLTFSRPGSPGICFESELCYRAWRRGYQVALTELPVKAPIDNGYLLPGGTMLWAKEERDRNDALNKQRIIELHDTHLPAIQAKVRQANATLHRRT